MYSLEIIVGFSKTGHIMKQRELYESTKELYGQIVQYIEDYEAEAVIMREETYTARFIAMKFEPNVVNSDITLFELEGIIDVDGFWGVEEYMNTH